MKKVLLITLALALSINSCTDTSRAKNFGGTTVIDLPCGNKLFDVTWKEDNLWYDYVPFEKGDKPKTHTFKEESSYGLLQGKVIIKESNCK